MKDIKSEIQQDVERDLREMQAEFFVTEMTLVGAIIATVISAFAFLM